MKIEFKETQPREPIGVGDFIMIDDSLFLIAQTGAGLLQLIYISEHEANRKNNVVYDYQKNGENYRDLPDTAMLRMTDGRPYKKVKATLIIEK